MNDAVNVEIDNGQMVAQPAPEVNAAINVEVDNSQISTPVVDNSVDNSQVINNPTPMDSNVTYNNLLDEETHTPAVGDNVSPLQGAIEDAANIQRNRLLNQNAGQALDNFLNNEYSYDRNEAGTYWVAGAINDNDTQMKFLDALVKEDMYEELDLQKYYYDTTLATARAYAASKNKEIAYGWYRAAQEKAIAEGQLTGWYMPAEGEYMLGQYTVAQTKLADDSTPEEEKAKARNIINTTEKWFAANQIGTRGIKCLAMLEYEETVRHNKEAERLQDQANKIADAGAGISEALADLQLREFKFKVEELELQYGRDFTKDIGLDTKNYFGHDISDPEYAHYQMLFGRETLDDLLKNTRAFEDIKTARGIEWLKTNLGDKYKTYMDNYMTEKNTQMIMSGNFDVDSMTSDIFELNNKTLPNGVITDGKVRVVKSRNTTTGKTEVRLFTKDSNGNTIQLDWETVSGNNGALNQAYTEAEIERNKANNPNWDATEHIGGLELKGTKMRNGEKVNQRLGDYIKQEEFVPGSWVDDSGIRHYDTLYDKEGNVVGKGAFEGTNDILNTSGWNGVTKTKAAVKTVQEYTNKGYVIKYGYYADDKGNLNYEKQGIIMYDPKQDKYISIGVTGSGAGNVHDVDVSKLKMIPNKDYGDLSDSQRASARAQMTFVGEGKDRVTFAYQDASGNTHFVQFDKSGGTLSNLMDILSTPELRGAFRDKDTMAVKTYQYYDVSKESVLKEFPNAENIIKNFEANREAYSNKLESKWDDSAYSLQGREKATSLDLGNVPNGGLSTSVQNNLTTSDSVSDSDRKILYEKYEISDRDAPEFDSIADPAELIKALQEKYNKILAQGGKSNG